MKTKEMVFAALFAALIGVLGMIPPIPLGFIPVPITAQTLGVMLAGSFLGKKTGSLSLILFIVLVALGLPLLSGGRGGFSALVGPSAGYILSWPVAAFCIGYATEKVWSNVKTWKIIIINLVFGVILVSLIGAPVMALITHTSIWAGLVGATAFLPGDCIKAVIAAIIALQLKAVSPIEEK
ncbi:MULTISPECIES: biotin transporter BioY [Paenibacillus]|uniref:Biotin transporter n=1 Tax=Paenibacillus borealis TaxID=160799 RepID=A0ABX3HA35_PAEBO|nr:biotin transporter BioY [Paenibacillus borealis]OMD46087.1 biotin transporter BioY [Paenibacillus borealis]